MKIKHCLQQKITAWALLIFMLSSSIGDGGILYAAQPQFVSKQYVPFNLKGLQVPAKFGEISETFDAGQNKPAVILIQDAHAIPDAQKNIHAIIRHFEKKYGVKKVALEGSSSELDAQIFRSFPDQKLVKKVFSDYYEKAELSGAAVASVFAGGDVHFQGVEDWNLYESAIELYLKALSREPAILEKLNSERLTLNNEKEKVYSKELLAVDQAVEKFYENAAQLTDLIKLLGSVQPPQAGSELDALWKEVNKSHEPRAKGYEKDIEVREHAAKVERFLKAETPSPLGRIRPLADRGLPAASPEVAQPVEHRGQTPMQVRERGLSPLVSDLTTSGDSPGVAGASPGVAKQVELDALKLFNSKKQEWMTGEISAEAFALYLKETIGKLGLGLKMSADLSGMVRDQQTLKGIEGTKLFRDIEIYIREVKQQLIDRTTDHPSTLPRAGGPPFDVAQGRLATTGDSSSGSVPSKARGLTPMLLELNQRTEHLRLLTKLAKLELSREEWNKLKLQMQFQRTTNSEPRLPAVEGTTKENQTADQTSQSMNWSDR